MNNSVIGNLRNIIFVSPVCFNGLFQRHQGIATELVKNGYCVYYVNPLISNGFGVEIVKKTGLKILTVKIPFKASNYPRLHKYSVRLSLRLIVKKLHLNIKDTVLWLSEPSCAEMASCGWEKVIYDCCDFHGAFPGQNMSVWKYYESKILSKADIIFVSHPYLKERLDGLGNGKCFILPNATSYKTKKHFKTRVKAEKIKLLSSGAHFEWVDINWLKMLASLDFVELHIAGVGRGRNFEELIKLGNVFFHGKLEQHQLKDLMQECHVGLVPFKNIELIRAVDPIKVYDYVAMGLHVWAPDIDSLRVNPYISCFISDSLQAKKAIEELRTRCDALEVSVPTWSDRVSAI